MSQTTETSGTQAQEFWAIVELMGHQRTAGRVSPSPLCPGQLIRIDVPEVGAVQGHTIMVNQSAVYRITVTDEKTARAIVAMDKPAVMSEWTIDQALRAMPDRARATVVGGAVQTDEEAELELREASQRPAASAPAECTCGATDPGLGDHHTPSCPQHTPF